MSNFERMFDNLDVNSNLMNKVMDNVNAGSYEEEDVNGLINQVAEEHGMKVGEEFAMVSSGGIKEQNPQQQVQTKQIGMNVNK